MSIHGVDVSNHQATFDFRGWQFAIIKASEGNGFRDFRFMQHLNAARAAGCIVAAYHYQRNVDARSQFSLIRSMVPTTVPVIIDVEDGSGPLSITRELIGLLEDAGYSVPLLYLPRWYWRDHLRSPSLAGLPPLWASDYRGSGADWSDYGGLPVKLRQYTSTPFDKNYFDGTREQFAALLGGQDEEDEVTPAQMDQLIEKLLWGARFEGDMNLSQWLKDILLPALIEVRDTVREGDGAAPEVDYDKLADKLEERGIKAEVDYARIARDVVAELKKEGN
jgi:lysozyme